MARSKQKNTKRIAKKIILSIAIFLSVVVFFSMAFAAYKARETLVVQTSLAEVEVMSAPEPTPIITQVPTKEPSPTPRIAFIPDPDGLLPTPNIEEIELTKDILTGEFDNEQLNVSWQIVDDADYYVFCATNTKDTVYHKEILWPDIAEWFLPDALSGDVYLFCYKDMGEDSAEDDELITTYSLSVVKEVEEEPKATKKPVDNDEDEEEIQNKYYIIVDKDDYTFAVFTFDDDGNYTKLVKAFPTAIGRSSRMTPSGTYKISSKGAWKSWGTGSYSPYYTRFTSGLYFHGSLYDLKQNDTMYKDYYNEIGTAASSGCLRTTYEAAKWVYYNCPAGTVVKIVDSTQKVNKVNRPNIDPAFPTWDPTDPDKPTLEPPTITKNSGLELKEGGSKDLSTSIVSTDENSDDSTILYKIVTMPKNGTINKSSFTQQELDDGLVSYTHDDSETTTDRFEFTISNASSTSATNTFKITINLVDDTKPTIEKNEWLEIISGGSESIESLLLASDNETTSDNLIYTITTMPEHGTISSTFTQEELLAGEVIYVHDGSENTTDSFIFSVSDGSNILTNQMFSISITIPEPEPTEATSEPITPTPEPTESTPEPTPNPTEANS